MSDTKFWDQLLQFLEEERVVPIVGRDLLEIEIDGRQVNLHTYLAERLAARLDVDAGDLPARAEFNEIACRYLSGPGRRDLDEVYSDLKLVVAGLEELPIPETLLKLAEIRPLRLFVSTTFDSMLTRALDQVRFGGRSRTKVLAYSPEAVADLESDLADLDRPLVFHLLGKLSSFPEFALTEEDTLEFVHALQSKSRRPARLFDELKRQHLLIIGSHFPDWLARFFMRATAGERLSLARGKSFLVDETIGEKQGLLDFLKNFSMRTQVFQGGGAAEFVDELHRRWLELRPDDRATEGPAAESPATERAAPGSVFLSYASDDIDAATRVRDALEEAGVEVWFDKNALKGGDDFEAEIRRGIDGCSVFIPLISRQTLTHERRFFRIEWRCALEVALKAVASQRFIVPVCIDDTPPDAAELPEKIRSRHWQRFSEGTPSPEWVADIRNLYRAYQKWSQPAP